MVTKKQIALIESKRGPDGLFSKTDLFDLKKSEQVYILQEQLGLDNKQIKLLSTEKKRVDKILKLQKPAPQVEKIEEKVEEIVETKEEESVVESPDIVEKVDDIKPEETTEVYSEEAEEKKGVECLRCGTEMNHTGGGINYDDYKCPKCKFGMSINSSMD